MFAAQVHVEDLVVAHIEQNLTMYYAKLEWHGKLPLVMKSYKMEEMEEHTILEMVALTL